jgi:hypothetical protein
MPSAMGMAYAERCRPNQPLVYQFLQRPRHGLGLEAVHSSNAAYKTFKFDGHRYESVTP